MLTMRLVMTSTNGVVSIRRGDRVHRPTALSWGRLLLVASLASAVVSFAPPPVAAASAWNNTNPGATICGNGSHTVSDWRSYYIRGGSLIYAMVTIRYSDTCHTVWTRVTNLTGSGAGYATARSLISDETVTVYNCPKSTCQTGTTTYYGDSLPANGSAGWSNQLDLPAGQMMGSPVSQQPPTVRSRGVIHDGSTQFSMDTGMEPAWTQDDNGFRNELPPRQTDSTVLTCLNGVSRCVSWAEPAGGGYRTLNVMVDSTFPTMLQQDMADIIGSWNVAAPRNPLFVICTTSCTSAVDVLYRPNTDPDLAGAYAVTIPTNEVDCHSLILTCGPSTALYNKVTVKIGIKTWDHYCGTSDVGCRTLGHDDDRSLISHEWGHVEGLGHCDLQGTAMCGVTAYAGADWGGGITFWHPQIQDKWAIVAAYP